MFKIPADMIGKVRVGETLVITKIGHGKASICGEHVVVEVPSKDRKLGERFFATGDNRLVKRLSLTNVVSTCKETQIVFKGKRIQ
ncbi:hypothetical protein N1M2_190 [Klebsiella phage N1M2]|uniref:Uncharacterized protein n=1 Tax=Klebsiella phage N1M2 TaxID=2664939 RepID=A0A6B7ZEW4_9CAUD|nr:hypothetical protein PQB72_gp190 [Klebsiella phage N1M2]QGH72053.1 hypothetical protein N1M2_190 [Klebsiella phage N1M2]